MSLLTVRDLSIGYDSHVVAEHINFNVDEGDYLCIVGENGAGKSTLMRTLLNLQPPVSGEIIAGDGLRRNEIGYLPQQNMIQKDFPANVREIVVSGLQARLRFHPFYNKEDNEEAQRNMERMGIADLAGRCYRQLSGGQQQRVLLARALCATSRLILLDEPVSGLDPHVTQEMYDLISELNREGTTVIMISHDIAAALKYANNILHIGNRIFFGTRDEYVESETGKYFTMLNRESEEETYDEIACERKSSDEIACERKSSDETACDEKSYNGKACGKRGGAR